MKIIKGDLLDMFANGDFQVIAHGCNCFNTMGAGIAHQIAQLFPEAYYADQHTVSGDISKLGNWTVGIVPRMGVLSNGLIFNMYTQYYPGKHFDPVAFRLILRKFRKYVLQTNETWKIGIPLIGCGIGGGSRGEFERIVRHELWDIDVTVVEWLKDEWEHKSFDEAPDIQEPVVDHIEKENDVPETK